MTSSPSAPSHPPLPPPLHISSKPKKTNEIITDLHPKPPPPKKTKNKIVNKLQNSDRSHIIDLHPFILVLNPPLFSIPKTLLFLLDYCFTHAITTTNEPIVPHLSSEEASERASERSISPPTLAQLHKKQGPRKKNSQHPPEALLRSRQQTRNKRAQKTTDDAK